jgi:lauroyl/myristoyl acyltransferase
VTAVAAIADKRPAVSRARPARSARKRTLRGRTTALALRTLSAVLRPLPDRPLHQMADLVGGVLYRAQPGRRQLVRANLERVVSWLADEGLANERTRAAATSPKELDRLVREAFGHYVRGYLEGAILPAFVAKGRLDSVQPDDPASVVSAFGPGGSGARSKPVIIVGLHFGSIEVPALWATRKLGRRMTAPMETVADPDVQSYFERSRGATGLNVIPVAGAATALRVALARGEAVALVADRPVGGMGTAVELFGAPARLPVGPAVLALETGAPAWVAAARRVGWNSYRARLEKVEMPADGARRQRLVTFMANQAKAFERAIADAPEQWWALFFPIWDDIRG